MPVDHVIGMLVGGERNGCPAAPSYSRSSIPGLAVARTAVMPGARREKQELPSTRVLFTRGLDTCVHWVQLITFVTRELTASTRDWR
jgi:hypothetical protein